MKNAKELLNPNRKIGALSLLDGAMITASKLSSESVFNLTPLGNGNFLSGGVKTVSAILLSFATKNSRALSTINTGMLIDGVEDLFLSTKHWVLAKWGRGQGQNSEQEVYSF